MGKKAPFLWKDCHRCPRMGSRLQNGPCTEPDTDGWRRLGHDYIFVDWSGGNVHFESAAANTRIVGALLGQLMDYLRIESRSDCVGFSYGASVCSFAGQWLREKRGKTLASCTCIDPSGFNFEGCPPEKAIDAGDCGVVKVIHASYAYAGEPQSFGIIQKSGKCDYYVNYGRNQPNCPDLPGNDLVKFLSSLRTDEIFRIVEQLIGCNHLKGLDIYNQQLFSAPRNRLRTKICKGPSKSCVYNVTSGVTGSNVVTLPPFDDCQRRNPFNSCGCLFNLRKG